MNLSNSENEAIEAKNRFALLEWTGDELKFSHDDGETVMVRIVPVEAGGQFLSAYPLSNDVPGESHKRKLSSEGDEWIFSVEIPHRFDSHMAGSTPATTSEDAISRLREWFQLTRSRPTVFLRKQI